MKSWLEISRARLVENVRAVGRVAAGFDLLAVVKADGYGHGAMGVAQALVDAGVAWLGVTDLEEGVRVREQLGQGDTRVLVMVGMEPDDAPGLVRNGLTPAVWTAAHVAAMEEAARAAGRRAAVQFEIDTGMARQGARPGAELAAVLERLRGSEWVECDGVFTHFAESEVAGSALTAAQQERFEAALAQVREAGLAPKWVHAANSSALDEGSTLEWMRRVAGATGARPMVRPGYALYGHCLPLENAAPGGALAAALQPVLTWTTRVIGVRDVEAGATVGYGATFVAEWPMRLALLPVGYADGFRRAASSGVGDGWVCVRGQRAKVVGRVSMNLTVVDVTETAGIEVGEEVVLLGPGVTAEDHARWAGTIGYEVLCGVRGNVVLR